jgi:hypothetical protein
MRDTPVANLRHPLADAVGNGWVITESRSPVIALTAGRINLVNEASAAGSRIVLVTDDRSSLTPSFDQAWRDAGCGWAIRESAGGIRDGYTGRRLNAVTDVFTTTPPDSIDDVSLEHLQPSVADAIEIDVVISLRHRARATSILGGPVELLNDLLGAPSLAWGAHEPIGNVWDRDVLTAFARDSMPDDSLLLARSDALSATIEVRRTSEGVEEITQARLCLGTPSTIEFERQRVQLLDLVADLATSAMPLVAIVLARPGRADLLVRPRLQHPPSVLALLVGAPGVRALGLAPERMVAKFGALAVGRPRIPALLFPLGTLGDIEGWQRLDEILAAIGTERLGAVLGDSADLLRPMSEGVAHAQQP